MERPTFQRYPVSKQLHRDLVYAQSREIREVADALQHLHVQMGGTGNVARSLYSWLHEIADAQEPR